ncbi:metallophosphoesterase family protein [Spirulina sp. 06S082]|uniref:metallophosphoesterase family protein n=1 Tax=Spirulina sp. 06S082 TaxID=3110248 RepID=UPI002B212BC9|nr:metallophosphoesterase [Spirulina sp. 06S082]MEA5470058.1 metallophosphoesterase [Spirulina sp. 06S082]
MKRRHFFFFSGGLAIAGLGYLSQNIKTQTHPLPTNADRLLEPPNFRFVSIADSGTGSKSQYDVAGAMKGYYDQNPYPLVVMAGDNIYNNGEIEKVEAVFERPYQPLLDRGVRFQACLGNHDIRTDNGNPQVAYPGFNMKGRYYSFHEENIQFFALDTNYETDWKSQLTWLENELSRSQAAWKIVFGHHQIYASGHYGYNEFLAPKLTPLFAQYGVQLYINGHEHHYERTHPLRGTTYITCGCAAGLRPVGRSQWTAYSASRLGFAAYEVYGDRMIVQAIATDGTVFDRGIVKFN